MAILSRFTLCIDVNSRAVHQTPWKEYVTHFKIIQKIKWVTWINMLRWLFSYRGANFLFTAIRVRSKKLPKASSPHGMSPRTCLCNNFACIDREHHQLYRCYLPVQSVSDVNGRDPKPLQSEEFRINPSFYYQPLGKPFAAFSPSASSPTIPLKERGE